MYVAQLRHASISKKCQLSAQQINRLFRKTQNY